MSAAFLRTLEEHKAEIATFKAQITELRGEINELHKRAEQQSELVDSLQRTVESFEQRAAPMQYPTAHAEAQALASMPPKVTQQHGRRKF